MLPKSVISKLNSSDVSVDNSKTANIVDDLLKNATKKEKKECMKIGDYASLRSFNNCQNNGKISCRMLLCLSQVFNLSPYYISGQQNEPEPLNKEQITQFLNENGFKDYADLDKVKEQVLINYIKKAIEKIDNNKLEKINKLKTNDILTLIESKIVEAKINSEEDNSLKLIKIILAFSISESKDK